MHLDRPYYSAGYDIWIKTYLVDAMTDESSDENTNLNIELIFPGSKIIKRLILRIDNGVGAGYFQARTFFIRPNTMFHNLTIKNPT